MSTKRDDVKGMKDGGPGVGLDLLERFGDDAGEALWQAGLAMLERAANRGREGAWGRYQHHPRGELRRLRRDLARAMRMCREATHLQEHVNAELRALTSPELAEELAAQARRRKSNGRRG